ncbi:MAG TPA: aminomethyl transferase family protein [Allosphingosinicella sp.]|nr:aminomethyl transferase family protein [Allosphingosinicella sp.]
MTDAADSFQDFIDRTPDLIDYFYNDTKAAHSSRAEALQPIPEAFSNWRDEQAAAAESAVLLHQTYNMPSLFIKGPDALKLLKSTAINTFENYSLDQGKQFIACAPNGRLIGDAILYRHGEDSFELVSGAPAQNWVQYRAKVDAFDVELLLDSAFNTNPTGRRVRYRFELAGPNAKAIFDRLVEKGDTDIPFFRTRTVRIDNREVFALRHGMTGSFAVELSGPFEEQDEIRSYILNVGEEFKLTPMGMSAYYSNAHSGWMGYPVSAIFTDPELEAYRRFLPSKTFESGTELGGSFIAKDIGDYYTTPYDHGYGRLINFDHDFHGRDALMKVPDEAKRNKVTLVWDQDDVHRVIRSQWGAGPRYKSIEFPRVSYAWAQFDEVRSRRGEFLGVSRNAVYQNPYGEVFSLAMLQPGDAAAIGSEVVITWGEPGGGSRKPQVERHEQTTVRARVAPAPYARDVQQNVARSRANR